MPCIPLGHAENFRKCIDARLLCVFSLVRIGLKTIFNYSIRNPSYRPFNSCVLSVLAFE